MDDEELRELQDPDTWDFDRAELRMPTGSSRAVVAVPFSSEEFARISKLAKTLGQTVIEFIHESTLTAAERHPVSGRGEKRHAS